ncbi:MAG: DNA repair protein RecO [Clostridia bacterium]|nr:DNA repair protein RecO [Clostridia bacterium]
MRQTDHTAIVLRNAPYKDNDRMLTLLSPTKGRVDALARGCRKPRSPLLNASELFALGDFDFYERGGRMTITSASLIETFYPLRADFDRLAVGTYLLGLCEASAQPGQNCQELFMLLLHTLSRLTFSAQEWKPLLAGFLLHYAAIDGVKPRLNHCITCGKRLAEEEPVYFDLNEGGLSCHGCRQPGQTAVAAAQAKWMRMALRSGASSWVNTPDCYAPYTLLRGFVETRLDRSIRAAAMLPKD